MKKYTTFLTVAAVIILTSCEGLFNPDLSGLPIRFGATAENGMSPLTKTAYSGVVVGGKERIDWENGDEILISMYYDNGNGGNVTTDLKQYSIVNIQSDGFKSVAQVAAVGDPLVWGSEGTYHRFVGIYPSTYSGTFSVGDRWNGSTLEFNLPDAQDGSMDYAYMAAMTRWYTPSEKATLDFYPMVTTLYLTLVNDTEDTQEVRRIELEQKDYWGAPLVGKYTVAANAGGQFTPWGYGWSGSQKLTLNVNEQIRAGESFSIPAFIIPSSRPAGNTYIDVVFPNKRLSNDLSNKKVSTFEACKKYNITVSLSGEGTEIEDPVIPDLPPVNPDGLENGACQFIYALIKPGLMEVFRGLLGNDFVNNELKELGDLDKITKEDFYRILSKEQITTILEYLQKASTLSITYDNTNNVEDDITAAEFLRLIPCVRNLTIQLQSETTLWFADMPLLEELHIQGNGKVTLHITNCKYLQTVTWWDAQKQNGSGIYWHADENDEKGTWEAAK